MSLDKEEKDELKEYVAEIVKESVAQAIKESSAALCGVVDDSIERQLSAYKMPKEDHYRDHLWISDLKKWQSDIRSASIKAVVGMILAGLGFLVFVGFVVWTGGKH